MLSGRVLLPLSVVLLSAWGAGGTATQAFRLDTAASVTNDRTRSEPVTHKGRPALRVVEATLNTGGLAVVNGATFSNGTIETEVAALPTKGANEAARGFVGVAFRLQRDPLRFECFYLRPTNGRAEDQLRRNHSTQYISHPDFPWQRLRAEHPGVYESYVDLEPGAWTPLRIVVSGRSARLFVHGASQPTLLVEDLKLPEAAGAVALWIGQGTEAYFGPMTITGAPR